jgi:predicted nucleic acid-binding Zn ribbon protein
MTVGGTANGAAGVVVLSPASAAPRRCAVCGGPIPEAKRADAAHCSAECRSLARRVRLGDVAAQRKVAALRAGAWPLHCWGCGKRLDRRGRVDRKWCSGACRARTRKAVMAAAVAGAVGASDGRDGRGAG